MASYIFQRLLWLIPVLLFISLVTFVLMHKVPGGPWDEDRSVPPAVKANLDRKYGLDRPLPDQYLRYVSHAIQGDLGTSFSRNQPVSDLILRGWRATAVLGVLSFSLATVVGVTLGVVAAVNRGRHIDYLSVLLASTGSAIPAFVLGVIFIHVFGVKLHWFPTFGWDMRHGLIEGWLPRLDQMVLPIVTLAALPAAFIARVTRAAMLDVLRQDYVRTARAKGLGGVTILTRHSLRNAAVPVVSVLGPIAAAMITGSFIVERLFSVPGTGKLFVESVGNRDYGVIMGTTLVYAVVIAVANLAVDVAYAVIDPRIRFNNR